MKKTERFALVAAVVYLVTIVLFNVGQHFTKTLLNDHDWSASNIVLLSFSYGVCMLGAHIVVGIWLFRIAKREQAAAWVWFTAGLVFAIPAAILFYCMKIYEELKQKRTTSEQGDSGDSLPVGSSQPD